MYGSVKNDLILAPEYKKCTLRGSDLESFQGEHASGPPRSPPRTPLLPTSTFLLPTVILIENPKLIKRKGKWTDKCRKGDGTNT